MPSTNKGAKSPRLTGASMNITDSYFGYQWHLRATTSNGMDLNVLPVWDDYRGKGVTVGVIDTRIEIARAA